MNKEEVLVGQIYKIKILDIFKAFIEICEKHDLQYFCHGGTAIGVVRHQGFIPWDDDIDVLMPRPDYEKFLRLFPALDQSRYELMVPGEEFSYYLPFTKMCNCNTTLMEFEHIPCVFGAFIDIFPLDGASFNEGVREKDWLNFRRTANKLMILPKTRYSNIKWFFDRLFKLQFRTALNEIRCSFNKKSTYKDVHHILRKIMTRNTYEKSKYVGSYGSQFGVKAFWPKEWFESYEIMSFEGLEVRIPAAYNLILAQVYGNYMELPPIEKRVSQHHVAYLNLEKRINIDEVLILIKK
ncbi:LicD family protein [Sphingobacterium sp. UT-1RO-CII-1]|uniref:LicD family protein n=1 Tax=Sphingobacterium sp. UT-1RO-CII-1 TaxID=2995225 RepID=UPI00227A1917|nr:LicD family protein [Sphingobacterium sp. UT-1RO-CII-1]MCY4778537.1 LicD family protein [Sphingobacterium sp. UT-1RO-CII-1]